MDDKTTQSKAVFSELTRLETRRQQSGVSKQRQFKRYVVRGEAMLVPADQRDVDSEPVQVHLRDVSRGGVGFVCDRELPVNSDWHVVFYNHGLEIGRQPVLIRHCQSVNNGLYLIGSLFCVEAGLLTLLGVNPNDLHKREDIGTDGPAEPACFLSPSEVA